MLEEYAFFVLVAGLVVGIAGWVWLAIVAFKVEKPWGYGVLLPIVPAVVVFVLAHFRRARAPLAVLLVSGMLLGAPYVANYYNEKFVRWGCARKSSTGNRTLP